MPSSSQRGEENEGLPGRALGGAEQPERPRSNRRHRSRVSTAAAMDISVHTRSIVDQWLRLHPARESVSTNQEPPRGPVSF